jgi:hypothetical protein
MDFRDDNENAKQSIVVNNDFDSNETDESDWH